MKKILAISMIVLVVGMTGLAQEQPIKSLTLADVIDQTLKNNLDLQIEMSNPEIARALKDKSAAIFIPIFSVNYNRTSMSTPSSSVFTGADIEKTDSGSLNFTLSQRLLLGGSLDVTLDNSRNSTNSRFSQINPRYNSQMRFNLTQPLLKDFGLTATKRSIYLARNNQEPFDLRLEAAGDRPDLPDRGSVLEPGLFAPEHGGQGEVAAAGQGPAEAERDPGAGSASRRPWTS